MAERNEIPGKLRSEVVVRLATGEAPEDVRDWLKKEHQVVVGASAISYYNAANPGARKRMPKCWRELFDRTREEYLEELSNGLILKKAHRIRIAEERVQRLRRKLADSASPNPILEQRLQTWLEHIAREEGNAFTNKRELTGADGQPLFKVYQGINPDLV